MDIKAIMVIQHFFFQRDKPYGLCEIEHYCMHIEFGKMEEDLITSEDLYEWN
jgi:hypothetical protein